ncbi:polycomb group protein ASXL1 isoform X2 [Xenopus laevis]|uniref:Polycomb group protein ASXL1 isoform X2 n=1 Tax=Xenopus laevis TaxID=8355 RepID=A0A8J0TRD5_XENLA|nr:polycomb group protein ASXL1 isoform X2 [Xenopus laevis]
MRDKQKRRRERTWAEAARMVLENYSDAPMTPKQILNVIESEGLKETNTGTSPLACLNAMLHSNSRTREALFYKLPGRISLFTMKNALQWSRAMPLPEDGDTEDTEGGKWNEGKVTAAGENEEACISASCSRELHCRETRSLVQMNKQKRRSAVLLPRVVLTPLKVNGAHLPSTSGLSVHHGSRESSRVRTAGGGLSFQRRAAFSRDGTHHLRGIRSPGPGQMKRSRVEEIDFETPGSILVNTNLRALINLRTFSALPNNLQQQLLLLLPDVDRQVGAEGQIRMSTSALNNEFFAHACQRWRERLADGEFMPEMQLRLRQEMGREKKIEDWKKRFFEEFYGQKLGLTDEHLSDEGEKNGQSTQRVLRSAQVKVTEAQPKNLSVAVMDRRNKNPRGKKEKEENVEIHYVSTEIKESSLPPLKGSDTQPLGVEAYIPPNGSQSLPAFPDRVPEPHPQSSEQKRKIETEPHSPSIEKKPRMEQRRSFRNTIQNVHTEKPQPTKEEPKVPPIRIQLSRIKPPWVYKGLPAHQFYPRIIPNPDPPGGRPPPRSPPDSQTSSIGGGGGPGGGRKYKARSETRKRKVRKPTKRKPGKPLASLCRTQLLSPAAARNSLTKATGKLGARSSCYSLIRTLLNTSVHSVTGKVKEFSVAGAFKLEPMCEILENELFLLEICDALWAYDQGNGHDRDSVQPSNVTLVQRESNLNSSPAVDITRSVPFKESSNGNHVDSLSMVLGDVSNILQNRRKPLTLKGKQMFCTLNKCKISFPEKLPSVSQPRDNLSYRNVQKPFPSAMKVRICPKTSTGIADSCAKIEFLCPRPKTLLGSSSRILSKIPALHSEEQHLRDHPKPAARVLPIGHTTQWGNLNGRKPFSLPIYKSSGDLNTKGPNFKRWNFQAHSGTLTEEASSVSAPSIPGLPNEDPYSCLALLAAEKIKRHKLAWHCPSLTRYLPVACS